MSEAPTLEQLDALEREALAALQQVENSEALHAWRARYFGAKRTEGALEQLMKRIGSLPPEQRPAFGRRANAVKQTLIAAYEQREAHVKTAEMQAALQANALDVTLPGRPIAVGRLHPSTLTLRRIIQIFTRMGFEVYRSPEVETDEMNFTLLNMPPDHPARDMWDTFYTTTPGVILRTHTSPGQIRVMRERSKNGPQPLRVILPGMVPL